MKRLITLSVAVAAMLCSTAKAEYVTKDRAVAEAAAPNFTPVSGKQYRMVVYNTGGANFNATPRYLSIPTSSSLGITWAPGDLDDLTQRWIISNVIDAEGNPTLAMQFQNVAFPVRYLRRGEAKNMTDAVSGAALGGSSWQFGPMEDAGIKLKFMPGAIAETPLENVAFFILAQGKTMQISATSISWGQNGEAFDRWDSRWALDEVDPSTNSPAKLALKAQINLAKVQATAAYPANEYTTYLMTTLSEKIVEAEATLENTQLGDSDFNSAKESLANYMQTVSDGLQPWVDLQTAITSAENRIKYVAPMVVVENPGFLQFLEDDQLILTGAVETAKVALGESNLEGNTLEEIAASAIEAKAMLEAEREFFESTRISADENAWYVVYSYGVGQGDVATDHRWLMALNRRVQKANVGGGDTINYRLLRAASPRTLKPAAEYVNHFKEKPIMTPNDSMLWRITPGNDVNTYYFESKANSGVFMCIDGTIDGQVRALTATTTPTNITLKEGRGMNTTAGLMAIAPVSSADSDKNGCYWVGGERDYSPEVSTDAPTDTIYLSKTVGDTVIIKMAPMKWSMRADRYRFLWSFQPVDENGHFFFQEEPPVDGIGENNATALKVVAAPVPSEDQVTIQLPAGVEFRSAALMNSAGQTVLGAITQQEFSIAGLPVGFYFLRVETNQGVSSVTVIKK